MKEFRFEISASVLVDHDAEFKSEITATNYDEAYAKAQAIIKAEKVLDEGTLIINMNTEDLARELGNMAANDDEPWVPVELTRELERVKDDCQELYATLEFVVLNANK